MSRFRILILLSTILLAAGALAKGKPSEPDFAYPLVVKKQAASAYASAMRRGDDPAALQALIEGCVARTLIDSDSISASVEAINRYISDCRTLQGAAMGRLLLAKLYCDVYSADRWTYNERQFPLEPYAADVAQWSGDQFREVIYSLIEQAVSDRDALLQTPITEYSKAIEMEPSDAVFYPTLFDFAGSVAVGIAASVASPAESAFMPKALLELYPQCADVSLEFLGRSSRLSMSIYFSMLSAHSDDAAPFIAWELRRLQEAQSRIDDIALYRQSVQNLYERFADSEYSAEALMAVPEADIAVERWVYDRCLRNLDKFPGYAGNGCLKNHVTSLSQRSANARYRLQCAPGSELEVRVSSSNVANATLTLWRVATKPMDSYIRYDRAVAGEKVHSIEVDFEGKTPFEAVDTLRFAIPTPGSYAITLTFDGCELRESNQLPIINCTSIALADMHFGASAALVADAVTGKPIEGAVVTGYEAWRSPARKLFDAVTDADGIALIENDGSASVIAESGESRSASVNIYNFKHTESGERQRLQANIFTSLPVYRPGSVIDWAVAAYTCSDKEVSPASERKITVCLYDANYQPIDTAKVVTGAYGRAAGSFEVPKGLLTGYFTLRAYSEDGALAADRSVLVSDYKLPTFEIASLQAVHDLPNAGDVTVRGKVMTYSGFPVADAVITNTLSVSAPYFRWGWGRGADRFYSAPQTVAAADGSFEIVYPAELLMLQSPLPDGIYSSLITATSPTGESQTAAETFVAKRSSALMAGKIGNLDVSAPVPLPVEMRDNEGNLVEAMVSYTLAAKSGGSMAEGRFSTAHPVVDWSGIAGGEYKLTLIAGADTVTVNDVCIYRPDDKYSPSTSLLWTPRGSIDTPSAKAKILLGSSAESAYALMAVWDSRGNMRRQWIDLPRGMREIEVEGFSDSEPFNVTFTTINNFEECSVAVKVSPKPSRRAIRMEAETFRDRITPGMPETWRLRVTDDDGNPVKAAVMIDMYNKAIDKIQSQAWNMYVPSLRGDFSYMLSFANINSWQQTYVNARSPRRYEKCVSLGIPKFNTFGYSLYGGGFRMMGFGVYRMSKAMAASNAEMVEDDSMVFLDAAESAVATADVVYDSAGVSESVEEESANDGGEDVQAKKDNDSYRPSEIPLALFMPLLVTEPDGALALTFTAPNANTTWQLRALAYTDDMLVANMARQVLASKPVMAQANLPRFLRAGDDAALVASVMNNTDSVAAVSTLVELFDPATGRVLKSVTRVDTLDANSAGTISISTGALGDAPFIGYRIKSSVGSFSDGEQALIPVLSTISPVIETVTFYSAPSDTKIEARLPEVGEGATLTLQYTGNPVWTVVTALPGFRESSPATSLDAARSIYSARIAASIVRSNPEIAAALRRWADSDRSDSTLVSMLERNADLKNLLLQATPWVVDAMSDSERMQRLALLLDKQEIDRAVDDGISYLAKCVCADGGWAWTASAASHDASAWATESILTLLGELNRQGALPESKRLDGMIKGALKYADAEAAEQLRRDPKSTDIRYTYMRQLFPDVKQSSASRRLSAATIQEIAGGWKRYDSQSKALGALILSRGGHPSTARQMIESLREYAISTPQQGMTWRNGSQSHGNVYATALILQAFAEVDPGCADIEPIRQWLILQKEALNWGSSSATVEAVNAILTTSTRWVKPSLPARFYLNGDEFTPESAPELYSGYLRAPIPAAEASGALLTVVKGSAAPAYGAVYAQYKAEMADVAAASCSDLSIEKRWYALRGGEWVSADTLMVGDRVKVELLICADRDIDYLTVIDERAACLEPVEQTPMPVYSEGVCFYRENLDSETRLFVGRMPRGVYRITYELFVSNAGRYTSGIAKAQSQYAPQIAAHSAGTVIEVK